MGRWSFGIILCSILALPALAQKRQTESELDGLRGAVKAVVTETAQLRRSSGKSVESPRMLSSAKTYDVNGRKVSSKLYEDGRLFDSSHYSDADGYRGVYEELSATGGVIITTGPVGEPQPGSDLPSAYKFTSKYKYKYDDGGKVSEVEVYSEDGSPDSRIVFKVAGDRREVSTYLADGSLNDTEVHVYD